MKRLPHIAALTLVMLAGFQSLAQPIQSIKTTRQGNVGYVRFPAGIEVYDVSAKSGYVDGYVQKLGSTPFLFPVGHNGAFRPFGANADQTFGAYFKQNPFTTNLPAGAPFPATLGTGLKKVSDLEYWDINGNNVAKITLTWNAASAVAALTENTLNTLTIAGWNGAAKRWEVISSAVDNTSVLGGASSLTSGSITTTAAIKPNTYNVYTLAKISGPAPVYAGYLESANCTEAKGWVWDQNNPATQVTVDLMEGGIVHATTVANIYRADVKSAGYGTGQYGYSFTIPASLKNGAPHSLTVRAKGASTRLAYTKTITCAPNARMAFDPSASLEVFGNNEVVKTELTVWPNPARENLKASFFLENNEKVNTYLINSSGQVLWRESPSGRGEVYEKSINLTGLANGIYLFKLERSGGVVTKKVYVSN